MQHVLARTFRHGAAGSKEQLLQKILDFERHQVDYESACDEVVAFLATKGKARSANELSVIAQNYRDHFGSVDNFNAYLGQIKYTTRLCKNDFTYLVHCVRMALVNSYAYYMEYMYDEPTHNHKLSIHSYLKIFLQHWQPRKAPTTANPAH
jgi:hypothetical protein